MYINDDSKKKKIEQDFINAWSLQEAAFISLSKQRTFFILPFQWAAVIHDTLPHKKCDFYYYKVLAAAAARIMTQHKHKSSVSLYKIPA